MNKSKKTTLLGILAVILFILGIATTTVSINTGNDYKGAHAAYKLYQGSEISLGNANLTAKTESAKKISDDYKNKFKKFFALSLLLYLGLFLVLIAIYMIETKTEDNETKNE